MPVDERRRSDLYQAVVRTLGQEHAMTLFELFPPPGSDLATQQRMDLGFDHMDRRFEQLELRFEEIDRHFEQVDRRFEEVDRRFEQVEQRFEEVDRRFEQVDRRLDDIYRRLDEVDALAQERHEALIAILRSELGTIDARILQARDQAIATSRAELVEAVSGQTRAMVVAVVMAVVGIASLAMAFAQLL